MALLAALVALSFGAQPAWATPSALVLPPVTGDVEVFAAFAGASDDEEDGNVPPDTLPLFLTASAESRYGSASAAGSIVGGLDPSITASASANSVFGSGCGEALCVGRAEGFLNYSFTIVGPATATTIPVLFQGSNSSALSEDFPGGSFEGHASVTVTTASGTVISTESGGVFDVPLSLTVGSVYNVAMSVQVRDFTEEPGGDSSISAYADPRFTINPSFANASAYAITYSPGLLGGTGVVPEPSSLLLLGTGLAGLLLAKRRARGPA